MANDRLSKADSAAFIGAVLEPPEPNDALKAAAARYKARTLPCGHTAAEVADLCRLLAQSADRGHTNNYTEIADIARRAEEAILWLLATPNSRDMAATPRPQTAQEIAREALEQYYPSNAACISGLKMTLERIRDTPEEV